MSNTLKVYKRGNIWWYNFTPPGGGERIFASTKTRDEKLAKEVAAKHYYECFRYQILDETPKATWQEAVVLWFEDKPERQEKTQYHLIWLDTYLHDTYLDEIDRSLIKALKEKKAAEGVKNRTINAVLQQIRGVLKSALNHGIVDKIPAISLLPEPKRRIRDLTDAQEKALFDALGDNHIADAVRVALATGLRKSNVMLKWSQVDLENKIAWIFSDELKTGGITGKGIGVPLNDSAIAAIERQRGKHSEYVFTYRGEPVQNPAAKAWRRAVKEAGLIDFHFHDLRHVWASRHIRNGTTLYELMELGGWSKMDTVKKYAHLNVDHLRGIAANSESKKIAKQIYSDFSKDEIGEIIKDVLASGGFTVDTQRNVLQ